MGALVVLYASRYLEGHPQANRFYASLFAFMGAMLGVVLSDNILTLFVFWELTGFTSFLLIGFEHDRPAARAAALQALIVTGAGGLALLAAGVLLGDVAATASLSAMVGQRASIVSSPSTPSSPAWCSSPPSRNPPRSRSTSGCRTRWKRPRRSAPTSTPRRW